jgi:uncharacterized protein YndB with AHSA1/START domain
MIKLENRVTIDRPLEDVWPHVGDPTQWHVWRDAMNGPAVKTDAGHVDIGTIYDYESEFMGRTAETHFEVVAYEPQRRLTVTAEVPVPVKLAFHCERSNGGTRVVQETEGEVGGFFGIAEPLVKPLMKRRFQKDLNQLRGVVEAAQ